jgi:glutamate--cysteine ligase catalytic subunit
MRLRRKRLLSVLNEDEICPTVVAFPLMGVGAFTSPEMPPGVSCF